MVFSVYYLCIPSCLYYCNTCIYILSEPKKEEETIDLAKWYNNKAIKAKHEILYARNFQTFLWNVCFHLNNSLGIEYLVTAKYEDEETCTLCSTRPSGKNAPGIVEIYTLHFPSSKCSSFILENANLHYNCCNFMTGN